MKLIIKNNRIAGTAADDYSGAEQCIAAPADYDPALEGVYTVSGGVISLPANHARDVAKIARAAAVEAITVTTSAGHVFNGDETSQTRMARAIIALNAQPQTPVPTIPWVLANNAVAAVTAAELTQALALAGAAQAAVWVI